jgi:hypothetical protein
MAGYTLQWSTSHSNWYFFNTTINAELTVSAQGSELIYRGNSFVTTIPTYFFLVPALRFIQFRKPLFEILLVTGMVFINFSAAILRGIQLSVSMLQAATHLLEYLDSLGRTFCLQS